MKLRSRSFVAVLAAALSIAVLVVAFSTPADAQSPGICGVLQALATLQESVDESEAKLDEHTAAPPVETLRSTRIFRASNRSSQFAYVATFAKAWISRVKTRAVAQGTEAHLWQFAPQCLGASMARVINSRAHCQKHAPGGAGCGVRSSSPFSTTYMRYRTTGTVPSLRARWTTSPCASSTNPVPAGNSIPLQGSCSS
jgi:hypothetical protein